MKKSAGILLYNLQNNILNVFLVHPGGPFFKNKDNGSWSIPKGEVENVVGDAHVRPEDLKSTAVRELGEETNVKIKDPDKLIYLGQIKQKGGKTVDAWGYEVGQDLIVEINLENVFEMQWPPKSGKMQKFSEVDRGEFFDIETAMKKINEAQRELISRLSKSIKFENNAHAEQLKLLD